MKNNKVNPQSSFIDENAIGKIDIPKSDWPIGPLELTDEQAVSEQIKGASQNEVKENKKNDNDEWSVSWP
jgi:hypothetical protein